MDETFFRVILAVLFAIIVPMAGYYRYRAHSQNETIDRREEGWSLMIGIRVFAAFTFGSLLVYLISPSVVAFSSVEVPVAVRFFGVALGFLGGFLWIYTFHHLGLNLTDTVVTRKNAYLVTTGPYRYVRHPFYVAFLLIALANGLATANWFILASGVVVFSLLYLRTSIEEAKLTLKFGEQYREYMKRTGRFIPKM